MDPAQDVICYHNIRTNEIVWEHKMTDTLLLEITKSNFQGEAELAGIDEMRRERALAWTAVRRDRAAHTIQQLFHCRAARKEMGRLLWKVKARSAKRATDERHDAAVLLQRAYRRSEAERFYRVLLQLHFEKIPDVHERRVYYCNHVTGDCTWDPPRSLPKGLKLHEPHEFVGHGPYVRWNLPLSQPLQRSHAKPDGFSRCSRCLQNLALLECDATPGSFCFRCFRDVFDADFLFKSKSTLRRVQPITCSQCDRGKSAAWRNVSDLQHNRLATATPCKACFERIQDQATNWTRI